MATLLARLIQPADRCSLRGLGIKEGALGNTRGTESARRVGADTYSDIALMGPQADGTTDDPAAQQPRSWMCFTREHPGGAFSRIHQGASLRLKADGARSPASGRPR